MVCDSTFVRTMIHKNMQVLILILLEYGLRLDWLKEHEDNYYVLILILLEYGLRPAVPRRYGNQCPSLNPYSIGIWSATSRN